MSWVEDGESESHGRDGAYAALREVVSDREVASEYPMAIDSFEEDDYRELIALAWRTQFDGDRLRFKRDLRQLLDQVAERILARMELNSDSSI